MKTRSLRVLTFTCPTALMLALPPVAFAEQSENDALQVANAKISLSDAVAVLAVADDEIDNDSGERGDAG